MNLIKIQKNLSKVTITRNSIGSLEVFDWKENEITLSIIKRANFITCLILEEISFPLSFISLFENLKELYLKSFYLPTNHKEHWESLSTTFLPNLQIFHCEPKFPELTLYLDLISKFIQNSCKFTQIIIK